MDAVEYAVDLWDLHGLDRRLDARMLLEHLHDFGGEGWELVWMSVDTAVADHAGPCHVLVFKRARRSEAAAGA